MKHTMSKLSCAMAMCAFLAACGGSNDTSPAASAQLLATGASASSASSITVRARGSLMLNIGPQMSVLLNGVSLGRVEVRTTSSQNYVFPVAADIPPASKIDIVFDNDSNGGGEDRNLYIDSMTYNGVTILPTAPGVTIDNGLGAEAFDGISVIPGRTVMYSNGAMRFRTGVPSTGFPIPFGLNVVSVAHKANVTLGGQDFGTRAVPVERIIFDDASGAAVTDKWDYSCNAAADVNYRMAYRTPAEIVKANGVIGGVATPHARIGKYISGAPYYTTGSQWNVCLGKNNQQDVKNTYISYYMRIDPSWSFKCNVTNLTGTNCDKNFKEYDWAIGNGYFGAASHNYYANIMWGGTGDPVVKWGFNNGEFKCPNGVCTPLKVNHDLTDLSLYNYYPTTDVYTQKVASPGPIVDWIKIEMILKHEDQFGQEKMLVNNTVVNDMILDNRSDETTVARSETVIGGYHRDAGGLEAYKNNFRYYSQVYYDRSFARVVLANNANYSAATIVEPQILKSWTQGQINFDVNLGKLPANTTAYLFVFDENGKRSATGLPVQVSN